MIKYYILKQIAKYLQKECTHIKYVKRVDNNTLVVEFNQQNIIYFDLCKGNAQIYKKKHNSKLKKDYNAPFDVVLQKRFFNSKISDIKLINEDKILCIEVISSSSYKALKSRLYLEFTGKYTNAVITNEEEVIVEALRHIDETSSSRVIKVGLPLQPIIKPNFIPKEEKVEDIVAYLYEVYDKKQNNELEQLKQQKRLSVKKQINKTQKLLKNLPSQQTLQKDAKELYEQGNLILMHLHEIKPYQKHLEFVNIEGKTQYLQLDTNYSSSSYANILFKKAKKAKQKAKNLHIEKNNLEQKEAFLIRLDTLLQKAQTIDEIEFLVPKKQRNQTKTKKQELYESFFFQGYKIMLGKNERENIYLLQNSKASDFWFHVQNQPSCHVIVQNTKKTLPIDVIYQAALLCAKFSVDYSGKVLVDFTQRRNVKIQHGANVLYQPYDTIDVHL
jgi:predicted ribosome quality control (RQC) complex YloA/Tae2 family protein